MTEKLISTVLAVVLLALVLVVPRFLKPQKPGSEQVTTTTQAPQDDSYDELEVLEDYPTEVKFPKDYILVYERMDGSNIVIIEKGTNYLVEDTAKNTYGGLFVTKEGGQYYFRNLQTNGKWGNKGPINRSDSSYMENDLTKYRWEYPTKFTKDLKKNYINSGKKIYIVGDEKIGGVNCRHYLIKSAWFEYNYWVHIKSNITVKYSKTEIRFGERNTVFEITAQKFSDKPSFNGYLDEELIPN